MKRLLRPNRLCQFVIGLFFLWLFSFVSADERSVARAESGNQTDQFAHLIEPGDTWLALAWRYGLSEEELQSLNASPNPYRQPAIGSTLTFPGEKPSSRNGRLFDPVSGGLLAIAAVAHVNPWTIALTNSFVGPQRPLSMRSVFVPGGVEPPRELPIGVESLEVQPVRIRPGRAFAVRIAFPKRLLPYQVSYGPVQVDLNAAGTDLIGLGSTGAFFEPGDYELSIRTGQSYAWIQPWRMEPDQWTFEEITLTGSAAQIDQESIRLERERLDQIWQTVSPEPLWRTSFNRPIVDFLSISSRYGARRSYNGGPYRSYHEGLDFSAYGGSAVYATAGGIVVLAEQLYVRGGAVIVDHGLGIYSGYYHMSDVLVVPGERVTNGHLVGLVGSTGLSTGNHLHWDFLVGGTWVNPQAWLDDGLGCWVLLAWGRTCEG